MAKNKNHDGWAEIFKKLPVIQQVAVHGYFDITATQIKELSGREARVMAKIDFREHLPPVMKAAQLSILAISNGSYRIAKFDPFIDIQLVSTVTPTTIAFPSNILTLDPKNLSSESAALDAASISGILSRVFGEDVQLTIRGRARYAPFSLTLNDVVFPVDGVQIEVDGGYEGAKTINLVEAKIGVRNNISVRQLVYPQMAWEGMIDDKKLVKTFICFYQEPVLRFIPVIYSHGICQADHLNELAFVMVPPAKLNISAIAVNPKAALPVIGVPFPQANRFETVLAMFSVVSSGADMTKAELASDFDIDPDPRHVDYYFNAMRWMGLVESVKGIIHLTDEGKRVAAMSHAERMMRLAEIVFSEPIFNFVLHNKDSVVPHALFSRWNISGTTPGRRLATVRAWIEYFETYAENS